MSAAVFVGYILFKLSIIHSCRDCGEEWSLRSYLFSNINTITGTAYGAGVCGSPRSEIRASSAAFDLGLEPHQDWVLSIAVLCRRVLAAHMGKISWGNVNFPLTPTLPKGNSFQSGSSSWTSFLSKAARILFLFLFFFLITIIINVEHGDAPILNKIFTFSYMFHCPWHRDTLSLAITPLWGRTSAGRCRQPCSDFCDVLWEIQCKICGCNAGPGFPFHLA